MDVEGPYEKFDVPAVWSAGMVMQAPLQQSIRTAGQGLNPVCRVLVDGILRSPWIGRHQILAHLRCTPARATRDAQASGRVDAIEAASKIVISEWCTMTLPCHRVLVQPTLSLEAYVRATQARSVGANTWLPFSTWAYMSCIRIPH